jgi:hypothetical protein
MKIIWGIIAVAPILAFVTFVLWGFLSIVFNGSVSAWLVPAVELLVVAAVVGRKTILA